MGVCVVIKDMCDGGFRGVSGGFVLKLSLNRQVQIVNPLKSAGSLEPSPPFGWNG